IPEAKIPYNPYANVSEAERRENPGIYNFQGLVRGQVEQLVSAMISSSSSEMIPLEWFRFDQELNKKESELGSAYLPLRNVLLGFHPETHPIVWRALISFFLLAQYYTSANRLEVEEYDSCVEKMGWTHFDYRTPKRARDDRRSGSASTLRSR